MYIVDFRLRGLAGLAYDFAVWGIENEVLTPHIASIQSLRFSVITGLVAALVWNTTLIDAHQ